MRGVAAAGMLALMVSCRTAGPRAAIDPGLASYIPPDTVALAGVNLEALRASALWRKLPAGAAAFLEPVRDSSYALLAYDGKDLAVISRGAGKDVTVLGSQQAVRAATAQHKTGQAGAPWLIERAPAVSPLWAVAQGGVTFPLSGDAANLNRFLSFVEYASVAVRLDDGVRVDAQGVGRTEESARHFEESLRAFLSLSELRHSAQVEREGLTVRAAIAASADQLGRMAGAITR